MGQHWQSISCVSSSRCAGVGAGSGVKGQGRHARKERPDWRNGGFGIYVHWPYCRSLCPYCDFNRVLAVNVDTEAWGKALAREMAFYARCIPFPRRLDTLYFGGGTPSLMPPSLVGALIETALRYWPASDDIEITLEANPGSAEAARLRDFAAAGVNRLSLGVQALHEPSLQALGRTHSVQEALLAYEAARRAVPRVSIDLIYARAGQDCRLWESELRAAFALDPAHLSLYQLTIESGTPFAALARAGKLALPDEERTASLYEITQDLCEGAGLPAYEISSHARAGEESRHNRLYWRYGDYLPLGPGAHGRLSLKGVRRAIRNHGAPGQWLSSVAGLGHGQESCEALDAQTQWEEYLLLGLRQREGVCRSRAERLAGRPFCTSRLAELAADGLIVVSRTRIRPTRRGMLVNDALVDAALRAAAP